MMGNRKQQTHNHNLTTATKATITSKQPQINCQLPKVLIIPLSIKKKQNKARLLKRPSFVTIWFFIYFLLDRP